MNGLSSSFQHLGHRDKKRQDPVDLRDENGRTPLMNAVLKGNFQEVTRLVKTGVNLFLTDSKGQNVLHLAAQHGDTNIIDVIHTCMQRIDIRAAEDMTPLMFAALGGKLQAVEWFLRKGALATHKDTRGWNVLHYAAQCGDPDTIALILPWVPNIESKTNDGLTPLLVCARHNKLQGAQYLHARGADLFATDIHGNNAMYHALSSVPFPQNLILHQMITADAMNTSVKDETTGGNEQKESGPGKATNTSVKDETTGGNEQTASGEGKATNTSVKDETTGGNEQTASGEGDSAEEDSLLSAL